MTLALHAHVVEDRLEEQTQGMSWDRERGTDTARRVQHRGRGRVGCAGSSDDVRERMGVKRSQKGSSNGRRAQLGCCRAAPPAQDSPSPLPSSLPRCCGGSLTLCWKKPLCSSRGRQRRTARRPRRRRCYRSSPTTGNLRQRARMRWGTASRPCSSSPALLSQKYI